MTMVKVEMQSASRKQKMNTSICTEAELVAVDGASVYISCLVLFIKWQGYNIEKKLLYQENKSEIMLEFNGKRGAGNRSSALNNSYFFKYVPENKMWRYFTTNSMQEENFRNFRNYAVGVNG